MFLNVENLNLEQLVEKQIELRQKLVQASNMGMQVQPLKYKTC